MSRGRLRALVVAYDFPPHGAIGTMRTLRLVRQLHDDGWDVTVLTGDPAAYLPSTPVDVALLDRVPPEVRVVRAGVLRGWTLVGRIVRRSGRLVPGPRLSETTGASSGAMGERSRSRTAGPRHAARAALARIEHVVDAALSIPDRECGWLLPAIVRGLVACRPGRHPDIIYSSAPPWTGQLVARALATILRRPWVADFRDPWARAPWREGRRAFVKRANSVLERIVIRRADAVLFVTRGNHAELSAFYGPETGRRFHLVPNGCDPSEFAELAGTPTSGTFVLLHAGSLYGARNPMPVVHAIARAIRRGVLARDKFRLRLLGPITLATDLPAECRRLGLEDVVEFVPRVRRSESLREMGAASALLLVQPGTTVSVPGKAYEYLAVGRPVLALAEEGETADLVRASGIGVSVHPDAGVEAVEAALLAVMDMASRPYPPPPVALYDGRVHAVTAAALLAQIARDGRHNRVAAAVVPAEESRR